MTDFSPTPEQLSILSAIKGSEASLMISAYAGTGKTTTLVMIAEALPPVPSLALAFNTKIKSELESRFPSHFTVKTLNGLGHSAWTKFLGHQPKLDERKLGKIVSQKLKAAGVTEADAWDIVRQLVSHAMHAGLVPNYFPIKTGFISDTPQNWQGIAEDAFLDVDEELILIAREALIESVKQGLNGIISFDDQIYLPTLFGGQFQKFSVVMVDEAQDLSPLQHEMIRKTASGRLIVVGDPRQAIYRFRGADSRSMERLRGLRQDWSDLTLSLTFRCPKAIVARQQEHAPGYAAAQANAEGTILDLMGSEAPWTWESIPQGEVAVLCRNNAPLLSLALKLLTRHIPCVMLGRDIGKGLIQLAKKILPDPAIPAIPARELVNSWLESERSLAIANDKSHKIEGLTDRAECLLAVLEHCSTAGELQEKLSELFAREHGKVTLSSIHRAKGLEWPIVIHLDPWRIPSKHARKAAQAGHTEELTQEYNLRYVAETRTKHTLVLANMADFG
jgi:DNA helicase-2/ATP-dependent DNA helicase PcrA